METIHIAHVNDLHAHLLAQRQVYTQDNNSFFAFDLGDAVDLAHPLMEATDGQAMIALLNDAQIDAATIGNNEGIGSTKQHLMELYRNATFPVVLANLRDTQSGVSPEWADPFYTFSTKGGHTIGVCGVTVPLNVSYVPLGWTALDPEQVIAKSVRMYADTVDVFIVLSHVGLAFDQKIAAHYPEIDVVIGAHTHHLLPQGEHIGDTLVAAAGKFGEYVGEVTLQVAKGRILSKSARVHRMTQTSSRQNELYKERGAHILSARSIAFLPEQLNKDWNTCTTSVQMGLRAVEEYAQTEAAFLNAGLFLETIGPGLVTEKELHACLPHPMRIVRVTLQGSKLLSFLKHMDTIRDELEALIVQSIGFRGEQIGALCFSGMEYDGTQACWTWHGQPIDGEKDYTFATVDHFVFANYFPELNQNKQNVHLFPAFLREVVGRYLACTYPIKIEKQKEERDDGED